MTIRTALRSLQRTPGFAVAVILSLALGVGAVGSMFAIVHGVLLAPLPYGAPDRLVSVGLQTDGQRRIQQPPAVYFLYEQFAQRLDAIGLYRTGNANIWTEGDGDAAERVTATWLTASMVPMLRVAPILGRSFTADEERQGGSDAVLLSEPLWRARFNAATDVIGTTMVVNSVPRRIVGVMPARFAFPTADTRVWLPVKPKSTTTVGDFSYSAVARLAPGASAEQAQHDMAAVLSRLAESFPQLDSGGSTATWLDALKPTPVVVPLRDDMTGGIAGALWMLAVAAGLVLLIAWANVTNLMLIRGDGRQLELAVRAALGASRLRNATHFFGESLVLGATAAILALLATYGALSAFVAFGPADVPRLAELGAGPATVGFIVLVTIVGVIVCTAVPALRARRANLTISLGDGARGHSTGKSRQQIRAIITVVQIALALVVSIGSALLLRTAHHLHSVHPGFDANEVTTVWTQLPFARYDDAASVAFYARLTELVAQLPSVRAAGVTMRVPLVPGETLEQTLRIEGDVRTLSMPVNVVDAGFFTTMRIPLLAGRSFQRPALERGADIIISQRAAATLFGDPGSMAAVGKRLQLAPSGPTYTVIGVVGDVRDRDLASAPTATIYRPQVAPLDPKLEPGARRTMALMVSSSGLPGAVVPEIRQIMRDLDPTVPIFSVETMSDVVGKSTARLSLALTLMTAAAAVSLLLGAIGLYGVMSYMVALRAREFGIRFALGADPRRIARWVFKRGLVLTACGVAAGFALYAVAVPFLRAFLYGVTATDPVTLATATLVLAGTAAIASWLPARRAARIDPAQSLRAE